MAMDDNRLLTRDEVSQTYGISKRFLEQTASKGGGPKILRLGHRTVRYRKADVEAWIGAQFEQRTKDR